MSNKNYIVSFGELDSKVVNKNDIYVLLENGDKVVVPAIVINTLEDLKKYFKTIKDVID